MRFSYLCLAAASLLPFSAFAQNAYQAPNAADRATMAMQKDYVVPYVGYFDIGANDNNAIQVGAEYRFAPRYWGLRPGVGFNASDDGSLYGYGGVFWDLDLWNSGFVFTPNFAAGLYHKSDGKKLGGPVEFRSGLELSYQFENLHRVGVAFNHISNASIYDKNPGAETLLINYSLPLSPVW